jgi:hypothetical protein
LLIAFVTKPTYLVEPSLIIQLRSGDPADNVEQFLRHQPFEFTKRLSLKY